ncbi:MAG: hypothetical protein ACRD2T_08710, partial [Thermoanaerobaculia bacterium]
PYPEPARLPPLAEGAWHTEGWVGAVLEAAALFAEDSPQGQERRAAHFLDEAIAASRELLM